MKKIRNKSLCFIPLLEQKNRCIFFCLLLLIQSYVFASQSVILNGFLPEESTQATWVFSGVVASEGGENYGYLFQMQRLDDQFHVDVALFDAQTKTVIFNETSQATMTEPNIYHWRVGNAFLHFNPINANWIFGFKDQANSGFNFKVDMLTPPESEQTLQDLSHGIELLIRQTGQINGHIKLPSGKEQFVTAKSAWFRQIWLTKQQEKSHQLRGVLCRFTDGSGFYSISMPESDALRGAMAGWFNAEGVSSTISQFINVKQAENKAAWHIRIATPNHHFVIKDLLDQKSIAAGFIDDENDQGFCMLSREDIGTPIQVAG